MSQIDLRQDRPTSAANVPANGKKAIKARRYVEGESDDDEGEIEDVVLGPSGDFDDDEDDSDALDEDDLDSAFEDEEDGAGSSKPRRKVSAFFFSKSRMIEEESRTRMADQIPRIPPLTGERRFVLAGPRSFGGRRL